MVNQFKFIFFLSFIAYSMCGNMIEFLKWKQIDFESPTSRLKRGYADFVFPGTNQAVYTSYNNVPMGVTHYKGKLIITIPRRRPGILATLNVIDLKLLKPGETSPKLTGYPNYSYNSLQANLQADKNRIVSVYRTRSDVCNRLWFIDTGVLEYPNNRTIIQPPSIWNIDLNTDNVISRYEIPPNIATEATGLASITVDVDRNSCNDAYAYIPDLLNNGLYVYSLAQKKMWKFQHNYFSFDPVAGDLTIANQKFQWNDGIFSVTLGSKQPDGYRTAYFHPMISNSEFSVSTKILTNETNSVRSWHGNDFLHLGSRGKDKQSTMHDFDPLTNIIFYAEISQNGIGCWNTNKVFSADNHGSLQNDPIKMIYPSDLTIDADGDIWVMTNSMPLFIYSSLNKNEFNFRIWKQNGKILATNSVCQI